MDAIVVGHEPNISYVIVSKNKHLSQRVIDFFLGVFVIL